MIFSSSERVQLSHVPRFALFRAVSAFCLELISFSAQMGDLENLVSVLPERRTYIRRAPVLDQAVQTDQTAGSLVVEQSAGRDKEATHPLGMVSAQRSIAAVCRESALIASSSWT